jgi:hypothetical protein
MGNKKDVLVNVISKAIVRSQNSCLATAQNSIFIEVARARNVDIRDMSILQQASAKARCSQNIEIDIGALAFDLDKALEASVSSAGQDSSTTFKMKNDIVNAMGNDDVTACLSSAVNEFRLKLGTVGGRVDIYDLHIEQIADAQIVKCIQEGKFKVGGKPLDDYLDAEISDITTIEINPKGECRDPKPFMDLFYIMLSISIVLVLGAVGYFLFKKYYKSKS